jgi:hypothetical protein
MPAKRYVTLARRPRLYWEEIEEPPGQRQSITVVEPHRERPEETGLLDQHGNELFRVPDEPRPAGFLARWEDP